MAYGGKKKKNTKNKPKIPKQNPKNKQTKKPQNQKQTTTKANKKTKTKTNKNKKGKPNQNHPPKKEICYFKKISSLMIVFLKYPFRQLLIYVLFHSTVPLFNHSTCVTKCPMEVHTC